MRETHEAHIVTRRHVLSSLGALPLTGLLGAPAKAATLLRIATPPIPAAGQPYVARRNGYFEKAGIDAQLTLMNGGSSTLAAVIGGAIDIGNSNVIALAAAHERGIAVVYVAPDGLYESDNSDVAIGVSRQSPIKTAKDLNGRTIGVNDVKNLPQFGTMTWIDKNGGDSSTVKFVEIPLPALPAAITSGRIDAAFLSEPFLSQGLKAGVRALADPYAAIAKRFMYGGFFATVQWTQDHAPLLRAFQGAMLEAARWANGHPAQTAGILARDAKLSVTHRQVYGLSLDPALLQPVLDVAVRYGVIPTAFPVSEMIARI